MSEAVSALHNMGKKPTSVVRYAGLATVAEAENRGHSGSCDVFGTAVTFRLSESLRGLSAAVLLDVIGEERGEASPESRLLQLIEERARELPIPDGAVVIPVRPDHQAPRQDGLAAMAVITKSSDTVWLRGKTPRLSVLRSRWKASLLIPPLFATKLEETTR